MTSGTKKPGKGKTEREAMYSKDDYVLVFDDAQEDLLTVCKLNDDVFEDTEEVDALFYEHVKGNRFKEDTDDALRIKYIIQTIPAGEIDNEENASDAKSNKKKKAAKTNEDDTRYILVQTKTYKSLITAAKKFKLPESSEESEVDDETQSVASQRRSASKEKNTKDAKPAKKIIRSASQGRSKMDESQAGKGQKKAGGKVKRAASDDEEEGDDDDEEGTKIKGKDGKAKSKKAGKPKIGYKKGKYNSAVTEIEVCQQLESPSSTANFECCTRNSNREVIRAAFTGNRKLLDKIVSSQYKISRLTERWGVDMKLTALKVYIDNGDMDGILHMVELMNPKAGKAETIKYGNDSHVYLKEIDTGFNDKFAYGVQTRKVNVARGGRQGNNAFVEDKVKYTRNLDDHHISYFLCSQKTTPEMVKTFLGYFPNYENQFIGKLSKVLRKGTRLVAEFLITRGVKNDGYGLTEFYKLALMSKNETPLKDIKKVSVTKKAFGCNNISPLHCACLNPNGEVIKFLLGINPEYQNIDNEMRKLVHYAACCETDGPLQALIQQNVDTRELDQLRRSPLMYAARYGKASCVKALLVEGRSILTHKDRKGYTALHYAAKNYHTEAIGLLVAAGIKVSMGGPDRMTALHLAAARGCIDTTKYLVELGAKTTAKDKMKRTPLLLAAKNGNLRVASYLLSQGAPFDEPDSSGNTPLHYACAYGYPEMIDVLLKAGADPNSANSWNLSPTAVALLKSYFSCLRRMLDDPRTNVNCVDDEGRSLISNAIKTLTQENFSHVAFLLIEKKADPNLADSKGLAPLDYLMSTTVDELIRQDQRMDNTIEANDRVKSEKRSLYRKYVELLIKQGADVNHRDAVGLTPIFRALESKNIDGLQILLEESHLELEIVSKQGLTIFHFLENFVDDDEFLKTAKRLLERCSRKELLNKYNNQGMTPLHTLYTKFVNVLPYLKSQISQRLEREVKMRHRDERKMVEEARVTSQKVDDDNDADDENESDNSDEDSDMPRYKKASKKPYSLKGGARIMRGMNMQRAKKEYADDSALDAITLTTAEREKIEIEAENLFKEKLKRFMEFTNHIVSKGADPFLLMKNPIKKKEGEEDENADNNDDEEMDLDKYFAMLEQMVQQVIKCRLNIPEEEKPAKSTGYSLVHIAASTNNMALLKYLVETQKVPLNQVSVYGESELQRYISENGDSDQSIETLNSLIQLGCNVDMTNYSGQSPMLLAAIQRKEKIISKLLQYKANVNAQDSKGNFPLLQAIKNKSLALVELLIKNHANPNLTDENKRNCIHWAINLSNADADASNEIENVLLSSGGNINALDNRNRTPLHYAFVKIGDPFNTTAIDPIETVSNILSRQNVQLDVRDQWGNTPLNYAAQRGSVVCGLYLLKNKAFIDNRNNDGNSPLNECLLFNHENMSIYLIQAGADLKTDARIVDLEARAKELTEKNAGEGKETDNDDDDNPYPRSRSPNKYSNKRKAVASKSRRAMDTEGQKVEEIEYESTESELEKEEEKEEEEEQDAQAQVNQPPWRAAQFGGFGGFGGGMMGRKVMKKSVYDRFGNHQEENQDSLKFGKREKTCSTFSIAIRRNWQAVAFLMLEYKFDLSLAILDCFNYRKYNYVYTLLLKKEDAGVYHTTNNKGQNLVHLFALNSNRISQDLYDKILAKLEAKNIDFSAVDNLVRTALHYACEAGCLKFIKLLLEKGLNCNLADKYGQTPLGLMAKNSFTHLIEFIDLAKPFGLDINQHFVINGYAHTVLTYIVAEEKSLMVFSVLNEKGADINKGDGHGLTPLMHMIRQNREEDIKNLIKSYKNLFTKTVDKEGRNIIHHVVKPRDFGSYENVGLLEFLSKFADINHPDSHGKPPIYYAKLQESGRMEKALLKLKAKETEMGPGEGLVRTTTSMLNNMEFPTHPNNYEEDFERFVEECKAHADQAKLKSEERVPVDPNAKGNYEVVYDGDDAYDCYMVKVDISYGYYSGNTFYKMQILREKVRDVYIVFTRWGRVGTDGQCQQTPFSKIEDARKEFTSIFKSKTGNMWEDRHDFKKVDKKYRLVPFAKKVKYENYIKAINYKDTRIPASHLPKAIYKLVRRICNYKVITSAMKNEFHIDQEALPLTNITKERLLDAEATLKAIKNVIQDYEQARNKRELDNITQFAEELTKLSSHFYELIPSDQYKQEAIPPVMNTYQLTELQKMVNDLLYFEVAIKMLGAATYNINRINPVDYIFNSLSFKILTLDRASDEYQILK